MFFFIGSLYLFFLFFFFALYFFDFFQYILLVSVSVAKQHSLIFRIEYSNFHKFTNPRIFQMQVFFAVLLLSIFFLFSFNSVKCHIDSMYWHFYLISLHFKCQISVILFFNFVFLYLLNSFLFAKLFNNQGKKAIRGSCLEFSLLWFYKVKVTWNYQYLLSCV